VWTFNRTAAWQAQGGEDGQEYNEDCERGGKKAGGEAAVLAKIAATEARLSAIVRKAAS
jgi:hypothetical protein